MCGVRACRLPGAEEQGPAGSCGSRQQGRLEQVPDGHQGESLHRNGGVLSGVRGNVAERQNSSNKNRGTLYVAQMTTGLEVFLRDVFLSQSY